MVLLGHLGEQYLRKIYHLLANNSKWLSSSFDIHESLSSANPSDVVHSFVPDVTGHSDKRLEKEYNPLALYNKIGDVSIDFVSR